MYSIFFNNYGNRIVMQNISHGNLMYWVVQSAFKEYGIMISILGFWSNRFRNQICFFRGQEVEVTW